MASLLFTVTVSANETGLVFTDNTNSSSSRVGGWATSPSSVTINKFLVKKYDGSSFTDVKELAALGAITGAFPTNSPASVTLGANVFDFTSTMPDGVYMLDVDISATESGVAQDYHFKVGFVVQGDLRCKIKSLLIDLANDCNDCNSSSKDEIFCQIQAAKSYLEAAYATASLVNGSEEHYVCAGELFEKAVDASVTSKNCCD